MKRLIIFSTVVIVLIIALGVNDQWWVSPIEVETKDIVTSNFTSKNKVTEYVRSTGIPLKRYTEPDWDCDDFARALAEQARIDGQEIGLALEIKYNSDKTRVHMTNYAIINNRICKVSAQTGLVVDEWYNGVTIKVD
jgi:hypothetical protein